ITSGSSCRRSLLMGRKVLLVRRWIMRSTRFRYSIVLLLWLVPIVLNACASGSSDPPVTPDTTIPSTLQVTASIAEDQDASDGAHGKSVITLGFSTNETIPPSQ